MLPGQLSEALRIRLLSSLPETEEGLKAAGFRYNDDYPQQPDHQYMEGFFHTASGLHGGEAPSVHPRRGSAFDRQPAPLPLAAFCEALRRKNAGLFTAIGHHLAKHCGTKPLVSVLQRGAHVADLSIQVHWGEGIPPSGVSWHIDAPNSFLHLAVGLQGRRALHAKRGQGRYGSAGRDDEVEVLWQEEGAAYLSSPATFPHAVEYPEVDWDGRIVAVQCRLLFHPDEFRELFGPRSLDTDPAAGTCAALFGLLAAWGELRTPSLEEVLDREQEMASA